MAEIKDTKKTFLTQDLPNREGKGENKLLTSVILLGFLFGVAGSVIGSIYVVPWYQNDSNGPVNNFRTVRVNEESAVIEVVKKASPAVVSIIISKDLNKVPGFSSTPFDFGPFFFDPFFQFREPNSRSNQPNIQEVGQGSGFIISETGLIVTNKHVVQDSNATYTVLTNDGKQYDAKVLALDPTNDLALVKIEGDNFPTLSLGDSQDLEVGQRVIAIGNSLGQYQNTVTTGVVSGIGRTITASGAAGSEQLEGVVQTDAAINRGNSGGPLLDIGGSVIGINTAIDVQGQLVGFAIPVNDLKRDIDSFNKYGKILKPFLGVRYVLVTETIQNQNNLNVDYGALLVGGNASSPAVVPNSAADKAGLKSGDVILEINDQRIDQDNSLASLLKSFNPGDVVRMKILSNGVDKEITVTLGESK